MLLLRNSKHGHANRKSLSSVYHSWVAMWTRCTNKNRKDYIHYGGRGITICERWIDFELFLQDMGERPKGTSLDRVDSNGNYELSNCRWSTQKEQMNNTRTNVFITYEDKTQTQTQWAKEKNIPLSTIRWRLRNGRVLEDVFAIKKERK